MAAENYYGECGGAYKEYLLKFSELGKLIISGVFYAKDSDGIPTYHVFGRTSTDPYQYYYRTMKILSEDENDSAKMDYTPWRKLDLAINSPFVSPYIYRNKLYIFWITVITIEESEIQSGNTKAGNYHNRLILNYSYKNIQNRWISPQKIEGMSSEFAFIFNNDKDDLNNFQNGRTYERVYPRIVDEKLYISYIYDHGKPGGTTRGVANNHGRNFLLDFRRRTLSAKYGLPHPYTTNYHLDIFADSAPNGKFALIHSVFDGGNLENTLGLDGAIIDKTKLADFSNEFSDNFAIPDLRIVHNRQDDLIFRYDNQYFLIRSKPKDNKSALYKTSRLSTSVSDSLVDYFFELPFDNFLSIQNQLLPENPWPVDLKYPYDWYLQVESEIHLDFKGSTGLYFRELFFHIPFLVADHLNAEGKYKDADWWYRKIFDPTAPKDVYATKPGDKNWRFLEFRGQDLPKYSKDLTDGAFLTIYRNDPFNPHAIARNRISAYQKAIILKYVDNLLDWADSLFRKFTFEYISEAMMLYILAQDILGERPAEICKCEVGADLPLTYGQIEPNLKEGSDFLIWLENLNYSSNSGTGNSQSGSGNTGNGGNNTPGNGQVNSNYVARYGEEETDLETNSTPNDGYQELIDQGSLISAKHGEFSGLLFCVPMNKDILALWDRVEDRLFKIRHCLNIDGVKQALSLFAPPIDPRQLVAARASGLSIADAIASLDAAVPPYRFTYILEKAKSFAGTVQNLGGSLLSALEKKDAEELTLLRSVHEQNILNLTREIKKRQIEENKTQIKNLEEARKNIENRVEYYSGLIDVGLLKWEKTQQIATHTSSILYGIEGVLETMTSLFSIIPQVGAPTAMTFGGIQLKNSTAHAAKAITAAAKTSNLLATSAGLEAGNKRREEDWKQQLKLAEQELKSMDQQIVAAQIRLSVAEKDLEVHERQIEQAKELYDFYKGKFTNLGLYKYMATTLNRLYSQAYHLAFDMAKKAEQCYRFEADDLNFFIQNDNWDSGHAGLLAGERLLLQLQRMERAYLENMTRREEITQSFSLRMINPEALVNLQKEGDCNFTLPEWAFDLFYPGHYRRIIKSVRITIPCVTGPYTNVSCRLSLTNNQIRPEPVMENGLFAGPSFANGSIATSNASNDGGQFELNFQDVRYLPFEGAGAVNSDWTLALPETFRAFDYNSISDAIIHISYSALFDGTLKQNIEDKQKGLLNYLKTQTFFKFISLKQEFPDLLYELSTNQNSVVLELTNRKFPYFLSGQALIIDGDIKKWDGSEFVSDNITYPSLSLSITIPNNTTRQ
ncbi:MAG: neuraminidase-like domain-containing protein [Bacteroidia bacterium]